jgi:hypothetical protein
MAATTVRGAQVRDATIQRADVDVSTSGQALTAKIVQGSGIGLTSTGADSGTGDVTVSVVLSMGATAPSSPAAGNMWWDPVGGQLYIYYNDGTSSQWVSATNS